MARSDNFISVKTYAERRHAVARADYLSISASICNYVAADIVDDNGIY